MSDCLIIGGGLIGLLTARELLKSGLSVTILDKSQMGTESSWAGGGILSPLYPWRYEPSITALAQWSQQHYPDVLRQIQQEADYDPELLYSGLLLLNLGAEAQQANDWAKQYHYQLKTIAVEHIQRYEAGIDEQIVHDAYLMPDIAQVRNPRLMRAVYASVKSLGAKCVTNTTVQQILTKDNKAIGVETRQGEFLAKHIVLCSGAWTAELLQGCVDIPYIVPVKGEMIVFQAKPGIVAHIALSDGHYLIPRKDGHIVVGSSIEYSGFKKEISQKTGNKLRHFACQLFPLLEHYPIERHWAGLRPGSLSGIPYIGQHPQLEQLYINTGHYRNGVVTGLASCRLLADILLERSPVIDPAPYALNAERLVKDSSMIEPEKRADLLF